MRALNTRLCVGLEDTIVGLEDAIVGLEDTIVGLEGVTVSSKVFCEASFNRSQ